MITSGVASVLWLILPGGSPGLRVATGTHAPSVRISYSKPLNCQPPSSRYRVPRRRLGGEAQGTAGGHLDGQDAVADLMAHPGRDHGAVDFNKPSGDHGCLWGRPPEGVQGRCDDDGDDGQNSPAWHPRDSSEPRFLAALMLHSPEVRGSPAGPM